MSNNLLEGRKERTKKRKERKRQMDALIELSKDSEETGRMMLSASVATISDTNKSIRLLDEGFCDNGFVLKKGAIEKYLNGENEHLDNLTDDFVGTVNLGHKNFATDPFILGEFTKADFTLVDIENERHAIDVNVRLDEESMFVKELRRQPYDIGVSAEFYYHINWEDTFRLMDEFGMGIPVFDEIFLFAYGLVGECGNVNSSGLELKGEPMGEELNKAMIEAMIEEITSNEKTEELGVEEVELPTAEDIENANDEAEETAEDEAEEAETEPESEEAPAEEAEENGDEGDGDEAEGTDEEELAIVDTLKEQIQALNNTISELKEANAALKKSNKRLSAKYQTELDKKEKFKDSLKGLTVELLPDEEKKEEKKELKTSDKEYYRGDGIGEI